MKEYKDYSLDAVLGTVLSVPLFVGLLLLVIVPYILLWQEDVLYLTFATVSPVVPLLILVVLILVHELIHGFTWALMGEVKLSDIKFGVMWKALAPYAHLKVPVSPRTYRVGAAMPGLLLGFLPSLTGIAIGYAPLAVWGAIGLATACGDFLILLIIRSVPPEALVRDHPSRIGCEVLLPEGMKPA